MFVYMDWLMNLQESRFEVIISPDIHKSGREEMMKLDSGRESTLMDQTWDH